MSAEASVGMSAGTKGNTIGVAGSVTIVSGGEANLKGAVISGGKVTADIGGNLDIESRQDTAKLDSKSQSASVSGIAGWGASVSASYSQSNVGSDYASVQEQSGIRAGDGGFDVKVKGNTDLKGGVISSTQDAIESQRNKLATATLTQSDVQRTMPTTAAKASAFPVA